MRRWLESLSIGRKITVTILSTTAAALLLIGGWAVLHRRAEAREAMVEQMTTLAEVIGSNSVAALLFDDRSAAAEMLSALDAMEGATRAVLFRPDGSRFADHVVQEHGHEPLAAPQPGEADPGGFYRFTEDHLLVVQPIYLEDDHLGTLVLEYELSGIQARIRSFLELIGIVFLLALGSAYLISLRLRYWITRPIHDLVDIARRVSFQRDYSIRAADYAGQEIGRLVDGFNEMLAQIEHRDEELLRHRDRLEEILEERMEQLREREVQLRQAQKMEAVGRLAGGIAHDFNNLLTAIQGYAQLVRSGLDDDDPVGDDIDEILKAARQASALTGQLLAFSRKQVLEPVVMDVNRAVEEMETMLRRIIGEHIALDVDLDPELVPVESDPAQIQQAILNLAVNGRDAMPGGGHLTIRTRNLEITASDPDRPEDLPAGRYAVLEVEDDGVGMDAETRSRALDPFFTTKDLDEGTGLGLSTVYGVVSQSGGHVELDSEPGEGTVARIFLPEARVSEPAAAPDADAAAEAAGAPGEKRETILVVEDEAAVRNLVERVLEQHGYRTLVAAGPTEALELWRRHRDSVELLLSDIVMPEMSGPALAREIADDSPELPVIFMSGYPDRAGPVQEKLDPETSILRKPFSAEHLLRRIRETLEGSPKAG